MSDTITAIIFNNAKIAQEEELYKAGRVFAKNTTICFYNLSPLELTQELTNFSKDNYPNLQGMALLGWTIDKMVTSSVSDFLAKMPITHVYLYGNTFTPAAALNFYQALKAPAITIEHLIMLTPLQPEVVELFANPHLLSLSLLDIERSEIMYCLLKALIGNKTIKNLQLGYKKVMPLPSEALLPVINDSAITAINLYKCIVQGELDTKAIKFSMLHCAIRKSMNPRPAIITNWHTRGKLSDPLTAMPAAPIAYNNHHRNKSV